MKYKMGDWVRIQAKKWMDAQEKNRFGAIVGLDRCHLVPKMQAYAGKIVRVERVIVEIQRYCLVGNNYSWSDWMFDPDFKQDEPLSVEDAIRVMLDGETLWNKEGTRYWFNGDSFSWEMKDESGWGNQIKDFTGLRRLLPARRKRPMTRWEVLDWAGSDASRGWVVRSDIYGNWYLPQYFKYETTIAQYQRSRLLPDLSGVDESTIQGFEVEE
jgi:hypothetical protein